MSDGGRPDGMAGAAVYSEDVEDLWGLAYDIAPCDADDETSSHPKFVWKPPGLRHDWKTTLMATILCREIDAFVEQVNLATLGFNRTKPNRASAGNRPSHPWHF